MQMQQDISKSLNYKIIGSLLKVLIDDREGEYFIGRTESDSPEIDNEVLIPVSNKDLVTGNFYNVCITGAEEFDLLGEVHL